MKTFFSRLAAATFLIGLPITSAQAEFSDQELENSGLVLQWETNVGGSPLAHGADSLKFWAHTTERKEAVHFYANGKLIKSFNSTDVDDTQLEATLLAGKSPSEAPKLGLEGATQRAEKLSTLYKKIGRTTEVKTETSKAYYAVSVGDTGTVTALDAESGATLWKRQLPAPELPILGPSVSDDYVAALNGHEFFVYRLKDGNLIARRRLKYVATGRPTLLNNKLAIPSIGGRLVIYDILNPNIAEQMLRVGSENRIGIVKSTDNQFIAWPMQQKLVVCKLDTPPFSWYTYDAGFGSQLPSIPVPISDGFIVVSHNGTVTRLGLDRQNPFKWKSLLGTSCNQAPVAGRKHVAVVTQDGRIYLVDIQTGEWKWTRPLRGFDAVLTVTDKHVFAMDAAKNLVTIDVETGTVQARVFVGNRTPISNSSTDRVVLSDQHGMLTCLREPGSDFPILVAPYAAGAEDDANENKSTKPTPAADTPKPDDEPLDDNFGEDPFGSEGTDSDDSSDDPFSGL